MSDTDNVVKCSFLMMLSDTEVDVVQHLTPLGFDADDKERLFWHSSLDSQQGCGYAWLVYTTYTILNMPAHLDELASALRAYNFRK